MKQNTNFSPAQAFSAALLYAGTAIFSSVHAALPNIPVPAGGGIGGAAVQDGDWMGMMGAYFKAGFTILGLVLAFAACIAVVIGAIQNWKGYSDGRVTLGELKQFLIVGVVVTVFVIWMIKTAMEILA